MLPYLAGTAVASLLGGGGYWVWNRAWSSPVPKTLQEQIQNFDKTKLKKVQTKEFVIQVSVSDAHTTRTPSSIATSHDIQTFTVKVRPVMAELAQHLANRERKCPPPPPPPPPLPVLACKPLDLVSAKTKLITPASMKRPVVCNVLQELSSFPVSKLKPTVQTKFTPPKPQILLDIELFEKNKLNTPQLSPVLKSEDPDSILSQISSFDKTKLHRASPQKCAIEMTEFNKVMTAHRRLLNGDEDLMIHPSLASVGEICDLDPRF